MFKSAAIKKSLAHNVTLWILLWILTILNIFAVLSISQGYSISRLIISLFIIAIGIVVLRRLAFRFSNTQELSTELYQQVTDLMERIRPFCDGIFDREIERITEPILGEIEQDFSRSMNWLWENNDAYLLNLEDGIAEIRVVIQLDDSVNSSKTKIIRKLQEKLELLLGIIDELDRDKVNDQEEIGKHLKSKALDLKQGMAKEKEIFYDYVEKLLLQQILSADKNIAISDYLNIDKLGDQFTVVIEKSIQVRLSYFKDSIIKDLEYMSADIVGEMQKGALQLRRIFSDIEELIDLLIIDYRDEDPIMVRRLRDSHRKITGLREQANDFLVTLAWQDILIEKRWQDIQVKLFILRDQVMDRVSDEVIQYIIGILNETINSFASLTRNSETALIYKACLDAEAIYQLADSDNIRNLISDGVYSLLQFIRPVELLVGSSLRFSEIGIAERRLIKDHLREPEYLELWENVIREVQIQRPELLPYIEESYPMGFASFCNSPYIRQKPENINDSAWMLFMAASEGQQIAQEGFLLIGLLLIMNKLRNKYIHPLKGLPLPLEQVEEIEYMRFCACKSIEIVLGLYLNGMVKNKLQII